jgi:hypothetical protein
VLSLSAYCFWLSLHPDTWSILNSINLIFHEAGHSIFFFFGEFFQIAAGSLFQIFLPCIFVFYFWRRGEKYSASLLLFWVGESVLEVAHYAADAQLMLLPLLGGDSVIHDWNYLLTSLNLINQTPIIAHGIFSLGIILICVATIVGLTYADKDKSYLYTLK